MIVYSKNFKISKKTIIFILLTVFFVVADRFLKFLCLKGYFDQPVPVLGDIFSLNFVKNNYISFSIPLSGPLITATIGLIIVILLIYWLKIFSSKNLPTQTSNLKIPLTILVIGAILNYADRIKFGYIIDYFNLKYFTVFNLADIMICGAVFYILIINFKKHNV
jgi:signal peptidase II